MADKEYDNTNRGVLFNNRDRKDGNEKRPDYQGRINVHGTEYWLSAWINHAKATGKPFFSLRLGEPTKKEDPLEQEAAAGTPASQSLDDEIPF